MTLVTIGDGAVDVDAHELGRALVLRAGPHGLAHLGLAGEPHQGDHDDDTDHDGHQGHIGDGQLPAEQTDGLEPGDNRGKALGVGRPSQLGHLLQKVADADGRNQDGQRRGLTQRAVGDALNRNAQNGADDHRKDNGQHGVHNRRAKGKEHNIAANHDNVAVGEVQHLGNAVDHRIAQGDQRVNAAQTDTVDQVG